MVATDSTFGFSGCFGFSSLFLEAERFRTELAPAYLLWTGGLWLAPCLGGLPGGGVVMGYSIVFYCSSALRFSSIYSLRDLCSLIRVCTMFCRDAICSSCFGASGGLIGDFLTGLGRSGFLLDTSPCKFSAGGCWMRPMRLSVCCGSTATG